MLGFDETAQGLMIALYIAMDSFGTACNVTGDGAIAVIMDWINKKSNHTGTREELEEVVVVEWSGIQSDLIHKMKMNIWLLPDHYRVKRY